jgi:ribosomal protein S18 acetylase RimI-like enzyme
MGERERASVVKMIPVAPSECEDFLRMAEQHFSELDSNFVPHEDWKREYFQTIQTNAEFFLRWIMQNEDRAGFILFGIENHRFLPRKTGSIYELYVTPQFRRRGLARDCAIIAIKELWALRPSKIQLEVVEGNTAAAALWASLGFRKVTERFVLTGEGR